MLIGPMIARFGRAMVAKPGGDKIGRRRLDTHFLGIQKLGPSLIMTSDGAYTTFMPGGCVVRICCSTKPRSRVRPISLWLQCWLWVRQRYIMLRANLISNNFVITQPYGGEHQRNSFQPAHHRRSRFASRCRTYGFAGHD